MARRGPELPDPITFDLLTLGAIRRWAQSKDQPPDDLIITVLEEHESGFAAFLAGYRACALDNDISEPPF